MLVATFVITGLTFSVKKIRAGCLAKKKVNFQTVPFQSGLKLLLCTAPSMYNSG